ASASADSPAPMVPSPTAEEGSCAGACFGSSFAMPRSNQGMAHLAQPQLVRLHPSARADRMPRTPANGHLREGIEPGLGLMSHPWRTVPASLLGRETLAKWPV